MVKFVINFFKFLDDLLLVLLIYIFVYMFKVLFLDRLEIIWLFKGLK